MLGLGEPRGQGGRLKKRAADIIWVTGVDARSRRELRELVTKLGYLAAECSAVENVADSLRQEHSPSVVLFEIDPHWEDAEGTLATLAQQVRPIPLIAISSRTPSAAMVRTLRAEAADYLIRPFGGADLARTIATVLNRRRGSAAPPGAVHPGGEASPFISCSPAMRQIEQTIRRVADSDLTILVQGESGTGKDVLARLIHSSSGRRDGPFVVVNCAALPEQLLESELFGYERGAFTGADARKPGRFEMAQNGTIFLNEIGEMSPPVQAKLLQVLQDKQFSPLGSDRELRVDVRVLAACNKSLDLEVQAGRFREDLYFRLHVIDLYVPPLRERREEIPLFVDYFSRRFAGKYRRPLPRFSRELLERFVDYPWPGNVRELENMVQRIVLLGDESSVMRQLLGWSRSAVRRPLGPEDIPTPASSGGDGARTLKSAARKAAFAAQRDLILGTLNKTRWNRRKAARLLGVSYNTLLSRIKQCGLADN